MRLAITAITLVTLVAACAEPPSPPPRSPSIDPVPPSDGPAEIEWTVETEPVPDARDAADDAAIWVDPDDPTRSVIIGTNKKGADGLLVYDLSGEELEATGGTAMNNVDLRTDVSLGGRDRILVLASTVDRRTLELFELDPQSRALIPIPGGSIDTGIRAAGVCLHRAADGEMHAFATRGNGLVQQWRLAASDEGSIDGELVRELTFESRVEGCVADDAAGNVLFSEESTGIWRVSADPDAPEQRELVAAANDGGRLTPDVEGLAIAAYPDGRRFLIASSQGDDRFVAYRLDPLPAVDYVGEFSIVGPDGDDVTHTDGVEVTTQTLGPGALEGGILVVQDDGNEEPDGEDVGQNFKIVPWSLVEGHLGID
ncbi:MAG: phytase [Candidatus Limnocylindria bacterium]